MKISIIIPVYNIEQYIGRCLESIISQSYSNLEIIVVNDGSTDNSRNIITKFESDIRVVVIDKPNGGLPSARLEGLKYATGDFLFHFDGDDYLTLNAIEFAVEKQRATDADIVFMNYYFAWENGRLVEYKNNFLFGSDNSYSILKAFACGKLGFNIWGKLIRRSLYSNDIQTPLNLYYGEDVIQVVQLINKTHKVALVEPPTICYVQRGTAISHTKLKNASVFLDYVKWVETFLDNSWKGKADDAKMLFCCFQFYAYLMKTSIVEVDKPFQNRIKYYLKNPFVREYLPLWHKLLLNSFMAGTLFFQPTKFGIETLKRLKQ